MGAGKMVQLALESGIELNGYTEHAQRVSLGSQLTRHRDQVIGKYQINPAGKIQGATLWKLVSTLASVGESSESK